MNEGELLMKRRQVHKRATLYAIYATATRISCEYEYV